MTKSNHFKVNNSVTFQNFKIIVISGRLTLDTRNEEKWEVLRRGEVRKQEGKRNPTERQTAEATG